MTDVDIPVAKKRGKRKAISTKTRFEVFKRDNFTCQYCGGKPPQAVLHVDHIVAVAEGGGNGMGNLATACSDCNMGKGPRAIGCAPMPLKEYAEAVAEKEAQLQGYNEILRLRRERIDTQVWLIAYALYSKGETTKARAQSIRTFLDRLPFEELHELAWYVSKRGVGGGEKLFRYFCGCCWQKIKGAA